ncbi:hypothetical protein [Methylophaga sp.]|uniref:hypothetical protein n=1 Tax=Methylophaga sp. TaxID=2024840 RepID=UPI0027165E56|nr:hypothetical protein [Methylophaga sp.]MDO8828121.1 hypothetical protein [Methylophaga sp.]
MLINNVVNQHNSSQSHTTNVNKDAVSFADIMHAQTEQAKQTGSIEPKDSNQTDFTNMTRQEMFDWMNNQIRSGQMTLDESSPLLLMTMKISVETGQSVDMATDSTRINFMESARSGIDGALSLNNQELADRLQTVLEIMQKNQG